MTRNLRAPGGTQDKGWRKWRPYVLALLIHGVLVGLLFVGINWKSKTETQGSVTAQVWQEPAKVEPNIEPKIEPPPEPEPKALVTPTPKPAPTPKPEPAPKAAKPDLVVEKQKEKQKEKETKEREAQQREELRAKEMERLAKAAESLPAPPKPNPAPAALPVVKAANPSGGAESAGKPDADYFGRLRSALRANTNFPNVEDVSGNPAVEYAVRLRADCGIAQVRMQKSSGLPTWDAAAERAIKRTDPFPLLKDGSCPQGELVLRQRLKD